MLQGAGFGNTRELVEEFELVYRDREEWWDALWTHGTRRQLEAMTPDDLPRFQQAAFLHLETLASSGPLTQRAQFIFVLADRPETRSETPR